MAIQPQDDSQLSDQSIQSTISFEAVESNAPALTTTDALNFLRAVKDEFGGDSEEYSNFLEMMKDFKSNRITIPALISRVEVLFAKHHALLEGFNQFLPVGCKISCPPSWNSNRDFGEAIRYVNKIKEAFRHDKGRYVSFLKLLKDYRAAKMNISELTEKVCVLFQDRQDLLEGFFSYLPDSSQLMIQKAVSNARGDKAAMKVLKNSMLLYIFAVAISVLVAIGIGMGIKVHLAAAGKST